MREKHDATEESEKLPKAFAINGKRLPPKLFRAGTEAVSEDDAVRASGGEAAPRRGHEWTLTPGGALSDPFVAVAMLDWDPEVRFPVGEAVANVTGGVEDAVRSRSEVGIPRLERMAEAGATSSEEVEREAG